MKKLCVANQSVVDTNGCQCPNYGSATRVSTGEYRCEPNNPNRPNTVVRDGCPPSMTLVASGSSFVCALKEVQSAASSGVSAVNGCASSS